MPMNSPLVTIGIPVFRVENYIRRTMESVLSQSYSNIEFLVIDDGSDDQSLDILYSIQQTHPRGKNIRILSHEDNRGVSETRNQIIDFATAPLSDIMKNRPENRTEARYDMQFLNAQKLGVNEAEIEKIKSVFLAILRDIKKGIDNGEQPGEVTAASMLQAIREEVNDCQHEALSIDNISDAVAEQIGRFAPMDEESTILFRELMKKMMEQSGEGSRQ